MRTTTTTLVQKFLDRLRGRTAWITGGKRIGRAVARILAEQGVNIVLSYRQSKQEAEEMAAELRALKVQTLVVQADVSRRPDVARAIDIIQRTFPRVDILVNMASVFEPVTFEKVSEVDWEHNIDAHVLGTFWPTQLLAPLMPAGSHVINIADRTSLGHVYTGNLAYVVTKGAVETMTRACATELAGRGLFVNAIAPGPILPPPFTPRDEWEQIRGESKVKFPITDEEAVDQFALLVLYLSIITMTSGCTYSLDQGQNL